MKKMKKNVLTIMTMLFMSVAFFSCGGEDGTGTGSGNGGSSTQIPGGDVTPDKEKEYIEQVAKEFVNLFNASNYQDIADLGSELEYIDVNGVFEDFIQETQAKSYNTTQLISMSNIKGSYSGSYAERAIRQNSPNGNLNITYTASDKSIWILQASGSGSWGKISSTEKSYYSSTTTEIDVPKSVSAKLTKNGVVIANVIVNITNVTLDNSDIVDLGSKMSYNLTAQVKDLYINSEAEYNAGGKAIVNTSIKKNGKELVSVSVDGTTSMSKGEISNGKGSVNVVILNKLNVKGSVSDVKNFIDLLSESNKNTNESTFDRCVRSANNIIDFGLYNNNPTKQASIIIGKDISPKYDWDKGRYINRYVPVPILKFDDGTTYSLEDYFDKKSFQSVIDAFENVVKEFERLVK